MSEKNTNNDTLLDCFACENSHPQEHVIICALKLELVYERCAEFIYDPTIDE